MNPQQFFERLKEQEVSGVVEFIDGPADRSVRVEPDQVPRILEVLRDDPQCLLDQLSLLSGVEYEDRFECVYHLLSTGLKHDLVIKVVLDKNDPRVPSAAMVHPTANWHERETYDLIGIHFDGHPDLRRIYLPEGWEGHPLRRDYVDPEEFEGLPLKDLNLPKKEPEGEKKEEKAEKKESNG